MTGRIDRPGPRVQAVLETDPGMHYEPDRRNPGVFESEERTREGRMMTADARMARIAVASQKVVAMRSSRSSPV
ncbi:MAG: hypothetical protein QME96_13890, partial [Myxococcota bacterium]|nr:hypothetical protein [Myxococcota bacterium]